MASVVDVPRLVISLASPTRPRCATATAKMRIPVQTRPGLSVCRSTRSRPPFHRPEAATRGALGGLPIHG